MGRRGAAIACGVLAAALGAGCARAGETVIVHLGDSITSTIYLKPEEKIDAVLQRLLERAHPGSRFRNVNLGLDGEWVEAFLTNRYDSVLRRQVKRADVFVIRYGTNDAQKGKKPAEFAKDLETLMSRLRRDYPGCRIILGTGPHIAKLPWCNRNQYGPLWQAIRDLAARLRLPLVDVYKVFEAHHERGEVLGKNDNPKDIHPNARGVEITAEEIAKEIARMRGGGGGGIRGALAPDLPGEGPPAEAPHHLRVILRSESPRSNPSGMMADDPSANGRTWVPNRHY